MKIKLSEIIASLSDFICARYVNLVTPVQLCKHRRGFAIISFLRKITKIKQKQMSHSALLEVKNEINEIKENLSLSQKCSDSKKQLSFSKKELVDKGVKFSHHIDEATKFIKKLNNKSSDNHLQELVELSATITDTINAIHHVLEWEETKVVEKTHLLVLKGLKNLQLVIKDTLECNGDKLQNFEINDNNQSEEGSDANIWIENPIKPKRLMVIPTIIMGNCKPQPSLLNREDIMNK